MNGKKWSELGFEFSDMDEDKTMTVKKANKPTKSKCMYLYRDSNEISVDERVFQHGYTGIGAGQQMVQQVQVPAQVVPAISTPNGSFLVAQLLPTNAQLGQCYYVFNQQVETYST